MRASNINLFYKKVTNENSLNTDFGNSRHVFPGFTSHLSQNQPSFTCSKLAIETLEQGVKYVLKEWWCRGVAVITTAQLYSTKPELRLCAGSNPDRGASEICDGEDLWQWPRLEIKGIIH